MRATVARRRRLRRRIANTINGRYAVAKVNCAPQWESKRRTSDLQHAPLHGYGHKPNSNSFKSVSTGWERRGNGGAVMADRRIIAPVARPVSDSRPIFSLPSKFRLWQLDSDPGNLIGESWGRAGGWWSGSDSSFLREVFKYWEEMKGVALLTIFLEIIISEKFVTREIQARVKV